MKKAAINGYEIYAFIDRNELLKKIESLEKILVAINAEKILKADQRLKKLVNNNIGYPDGVGAVLALRQKGLEAVKIPGAEFWLDIIRSYPEKTYYLIGSTQEVIEKTVEKLKVEFPNIQIKGYRNGYINEEDKDSLKKELVSLQPEVVFVAQGSPRQEYLMDELMQVHPALYMGLGGSYDVYCGYKNRAPKFFIKFGLEWLYRLTKEPTRVGRQMRLVRFLILLLLKKL